ncbi:cobalamin B12-binding domain-containing protein [bacterium]|nr:cobalamin B12-binding domain-containing protein [bacterium]
MPKHVALITLYNPGAIGPRYVAAQILAAGHDVKFVHLKELLAVAIPTTEYAKHEELKTRHQDVSYVAFQHPGEILYVPYPTPITNREMDLLCEEIRAFEPDLIGLSMYSVTARVARRVTRIVHERLAGTPVLWGGIHCIIDPEDCLTGLESDPGQVPDILCVTEGEGPIPALLDRWEEYAGGGSPEIPGIWFVRDGEVKRFEREPFETDLDKYAFPVYNIRESLIEGDGVDRKFEDPRGAILPHIFAITERGCPFHCSYCVHSVLNRMDKEHGRVRRRSVDNVLEEAERRVEENGLSFLPIFDEIFGFQKKWVFEFAAKWRERFKPHGISFGGYLHPLASSLEMVQTLFEAGMSRTGMGVQTGSPRVNEDVYERRFVREKIVELSEHIAAFPFEDVQIDLLADSPYETEDDRRLTLELLLDLAPPFRVETCGLVTYSRSELANKPRLMDEVPWDERLFWNMLFHLTGSRDISKKQIIEWSRAPHLRENPLELEKIAVRLRGEYFINNPGFIRPYQRLRENVPVHPIVHSTEFRRDQVRAASLGDRARRVIRKLTRG